MPGPASSEFRLVIAGEQTLGACVRYPIGHEGRFEEGARGLRIGGRQRGGLTACRVPIAHDARIADAAEGRIRGLLLDVAAGAAEGLERASGIGVGPSRQFVKAGGSERERGGWDDRNRGLGRCHAAEKRCRRDQAEDLRPVPPLHWR